MFPLITHKSTRKGASTVLPEQNWQLYSKVLVKLAFILLTFRAVSALNLLGPTGTLWIGYILMATLSKTFTAEAKRVRETT